MTDYTRAPDYTCIVGSVAYGLATEDSDEDVRGFFIADTLDLASLTPVPDQISLPDHADSTLWEVGKFVRLALQANPNILECLWSPIVTAASYDAQDLLSIRDAFLSKRVYKTFGGYATSQMRKIEAAQRYDWDINWKNAMHLIRLLIMGYVALEEGEIMVHVGALRGQLLEIRRGERPLQEVLEWQLRLNAQLRRAYENTALPDEPNTERVNDWLREVRYRHLGRTD